MKIKGLFKAVAALMAAGALILSLGMRASVSAYGGVYEKTVRLHVLADSDKEEAQALKLLVRDELLAFLQGELADCTGKEQAKVRLKELIPRMKALCEDTLLQKDCVLPVQVSLSEEYYPERVYEHCVYPAGKYTSLRVLIGSGEGKNWWCVVYPPLCLSASAAVDGKQEYTKKEEQLLSGKKGFKVRFALLELGEYICSLFEA